MNRDNVSKIKKEAWIIAISEKRFDLVALAFLNSIDIEDEEAKTTLASLLDNVFTSGEIEGIKFCKKELEK